MAVSLNRWSDIGFAAIIDENLHRAAVAWRVWLIPLMWVFCACFLLGVIRRAVCPSSERARTIALVIGWFVELICLTCLGCNIYVLTDYDLYAAFVARSTVIITALSAAGVAAFAALVIFAVYKRRSCLCLTSFWVLLLLICAIVVCTLFLACVSPRTTFMNLIP